MTPKELLTALADTLKTHEVCTLTSAPTTLIIDIEHNHDFHAVGRLSKGDIDTCHPEFSLCNPFEYSYYKRYDSHKRANEFISVLTDFKVYRWSLKQTGEHPYEWTLSIETCQC